MMAPLKLYINYLGSKENYGQGKPVPKEHRDLCIYYSNTNSKPDEQSCDGMAINSACLILNNGEDRFFTKEYLYLKMWSDMGCKARLKLVYPKQDLHDEKMRKEENAPVMIKNKNQPQQKNRLQKDIDEQIRELMAEPRLYDSFVNQ